MSPERARGRRRAKPADEAARGPDGDGRRAPGERAAGDGAADGDAADGGFDERLERLEDVVARLESGELSLEESIDLYTRGIELLKGCHELFAAHRRRVDELTRDAENALVAFDEDPDFAADEDGEER